MLIVSSENYAISQTTHSKALKVNIYTQLSMHKSYIVSGVHHLNPMEKGVCNTANSNGDQTLTTVFINFLIRICTGWMSEYVITTSKATTLKWKEQA